MAVLYSVACEEGDCSSRLLHKVAVIDDAGHVYGLEDVVLALREDVRVGLLMTEPYIPGGSTLSLSGPGWQVDFLQNYAPDSVVDFFEAGRLAPQDGVDSGRYRITVGGPPGADVAEVSLTGAGETRTVYGRIDDESGTGRPITAEEYATLRADNRAAVSR
jgi:hypothetical protein